MRKTNYIIYILLAMEVAFSCLFQSCGKPELNQKIEKPVRELNAESFPDYKNFNDQNTLERILWNDPLKPVNYNKQYEELPASMKIPEGMLFVPGKSEFSEETEVGFFADSNAVSVKDFKAFVEETNYKTVAEIKGYSIVKNIKVSGSNWMYSKGSKEGQSEFGSTVYQISFVDAKAYCRWKNKRIPTEKEWLYLIRNKDIPFQYKQGLTWTDTWVYPDNSNPWIFVPEADSRKKVLGYQTNQDLTNGLAKPEILQLDFPSDYSSSEICFRCVMDIQTSLKTKQKSVDSIP